jgi:hypothetical protein
MTMTDKIEQAIYDFVANNYGESEADEPSWDIASLAGVVADQAKAEFEAETVWRITTCDVDAVIDDSQNPDPDLYDDTTPEERQNAYSFVGKNFGQDWWEEVACILHCR